MFSFFHRNLPWEDQSLKMKNTNYNGLNAKSFIPFFKDVGKARCRLSKRSFYALGMKVGSIVVIAFELDNLTVKVLCTVWPDNENILEEKQICFDDTVRLGGKGGSWVDCCCQISEIFNPRECRSFKTLSTPLPTIAVLNGLPVMSGAIIESKYGGNVFEILVR